MYDGWEIISIWGGMEMIDREYGNKKISLLVGKGHDISLGL